MFLDLKPQFINEKLCCYTPWTDSDSYRGLDNYYEVGRLAV